MEKKLKPLRSITRVFPISYQRAADLERRGILPTVRLGRQVFIDPEQIQEFIESGGRALLVSAGAAAFVLTVVHSPYGLFVALVLGGFAVTRPCPACFGRGTVPETPCPTCAGAGSLRQSRARRAVDT